MITLTYSNMLQFKNIKINIKCKSVKDLSMS